MIGIRTERPLLGVMLPGCVARKAATVALLLCLGSCGGDSSTGASSDGGGAVFPSGQLSLVAGSIGGLGNLDGPGDVARFTAPRDVDLDGAGIAYVADGHAIRAVSATGEVRTLAGRTGDAGLVDGAGDEARFNGPLGLAVHPSGDLIVADTGNHVVRRVTPSGIVSTFAGTGAAGGDDGPASQATFESPNKVVIDRYGDVYVGSYASLRRIDASDQVTTVTVRTPGTVSSGTDAFAWISGFAFDAQDVLHIVDGVLAQLVRISPDGKPIFIARIPNPSMSVSVQDLAYGADGNFYAPADREIWRVSPTGDVATLAGYHWAPPATVDGTEGFATFHDLWGMAIDSSGAMLVTEPVAGTLRRVYPDGRVTTVAGLPPSLDHRDGVGSGARFARPPRQGSGMAVTPDGTVLLADDTFVRAVDPRGGTATLLQADAVLPHWLALTSTASGDHVIGGATPALRTRAGSIAVLPGAAAAVNASAFAVDDRGNLYASYNRFNTACGRFCFGPREYFGYSVVGSELRRITPEGEVVVLAGSALEVGSADGQSNTALFRDARGIAVDRSGTVYLADRGNHAIRRITPDGTVSTLAGRAGEPGAVDGPGAVARLNQPVDVALDSRGMLYVADAGNHLVRRIDPEGNVTTVVGTPGSVGIRPGALPGSLSDISAIAADGERLYIATRSAVLVAVP